MKNTPAPKRIPYQNIPKGTSSTGYVDNLIAFLENVLPNFPKVKRLGKDQSENDLTEELYKYLTRERRIAELPYEFQPEKSQKMPKGHAKRIDIAARVLTVDINMEVVYCLEAKKLPTDKPGSKREREYVSGETGGIERFKNGAHGKDDYGNLLPRNGMVAYVTKYSFPHWRTKINAWIDTAGWPKNEYLIENCFRGIGKLTSNHLRTSGEDLELTHFWVKV